MLLGVIFVIIFLSVLILVHELGHFLTAKKFGLLVEEFGFGLPPRIWGKKIGETIYSINALPFGGFVKIYGEDKEDKLAENKEIETISIEEEKVEINNGEISEEIISETIITEKTPDRSFSSLFIWKRMVIIVAGVVMNFLFGWLVISIILSMGVPQSVVISEIFKGAPAETAGLKVGDVILGMSANDFIKFTNDNKGKEITIKVERDGVEKEIKATPRLNPPAGEGALGIGLLESGAPSQNFFAALWDGLKMSVEIVKLIFVALFNLIAGVFTGNKVSLEQVSGPVGIVKITAQASGLGLVYLLQLLALISFNLAVINIFPFPALDGGRLLFLFIEKIKGSPLPAKFENYANASGMALLLILMVLITIRDIVRF
ncbi:MAG: RIP metalloprotease RseP [Candidatus Paceibacterota bacterium]